MNKLNLNHFIITDFELKSNLEKYLHSDFIDCINFSPTCIEQSNMYIENINKMLSSNILDISNINVQELIKEIQLINNTTFNVAEQMEIDTLKASLKVFIARNTIRQQLVNNYFELAVHELNL